jgi:spermidine synthase
MPILPFLLVLFVGSGCAALIYEVVWFQLLTLIVGSSAVSMGVVLATFMGGMCIGSLGLARVVSARAHPLRVYAMLEAGIGVFGLLILFGLPYAGGLYIAIGGPGAIGLVVRAIFCAICLLPPTIMMGATLPAASRFVKSTPEGVSWLGFFYGGNTFGAVLGTLVAGFYLLRVHDSAVATYAAVGLNAAIAILGLTLAQASPYIADETTAATTAPVSIPREARAVLVVIALSGFTALASEVVWTRLLALLLGGTVYTFSLILGAILIGLGVGSSLGALVGRAVTSPRAALAWCQFLLAGALAWAGFTLTRQLPFWPVDPQLASGSVLFQADLARCLWVTLPAACLWGASFPIALAAVASKDQDPGRLVGVVYAANTLGAIGGALLGSLVFIATLGTQKTQWILIGVASLSALLATLPRERTKEQQQRLIVRAAGLAIVMLALQRLVAPVPELLVAYGRFAAMRQTDHGDIIYVGEGMNSSMAVSRLSNGVLNYHNAGKIQASSEPQDMRLQRMLGHMTTLIPAKANKVLVIGCGAGVTAGAVSVDPVVTDQIIAEIEPLVPQVVSTYFSEHNFNVVNNPKVHVHTDDARHFLLTTRDMFDAITSDPFDPWVKGAATLYTKEFFELAKEHLNPGGVVTVFVQLYESNTEAVKSEIGTFFDAFPNGMVFANTDNGLGYDVVLVGQVEKTHINLDDLDERLSRPEYETVRKSLSEIGFNSAEELFATYLGNAKDLAPWLADAQINRDRNLRLQYLAGLGLNLYEQDAIYRQMLPFRHFPDDLFTGSQSKIDYVRNATMFPFTPIE